MINGPGKPHLCTYSYEDDDPFNEDCRCSVGVDHDEEDLPSEAVVPAALDLLADLGWIGHPGGAA